MVGQRYLFARNPTVVNLHVDITKSFRDKIKAILVTKPEFAPLAKEIFERELREAEEDIELLKGLYDS